MRPDPCKQYDSTVGNLHPELQQYFFHCFRSQNLKRLCSNLQILVSEKKYAKAHIKKMLRMISEYLFIF